MKVVSERPVEFKALEPALITSKAFAHVASQHLNPKPAAFDRPTHAEIPLAGLHFTKRKAMSKRRIEVSAVCLISFDCRAEWFIHASCPNTTKDAVRLAASAGPSKVKVVVVFAVTLNCDPPPFPVITTT